MRLWVDSKSNEVARALIFKYPKGTGRRSNWNGLSCRSGRGDLVVIYIDERDA